MKPQPHRVAEMPAQAAATPADRSCNDRQLEWDAGHLQVHSYPELLVSPASTWSYRGEGNANIVFSGRILSSSVRAHLGTSHLILRVAKRAVQSNPAATDGEEGERGSSHGQFALSTVRFITQVINPLFPARFLPHMIAVQVTPDFLLALDAASSSARPSARTAKGMIDTTQTVALLSPDYARMDLGGGSDQVETMCLEIKPKWLFIPRRHRPPVAHDAVECSRPNRTPPPGSTFSSSPLPSPSPSPSPPIPLACRFCAHQRYKLATDPNHTQLSAFCPLDLLSRTTIRDVVKALLDTPNNNLRVWMNGQRTKAPTAETCVFEKSDGWRVPLDMVLSEILNELVPLFTTLGEHQSSLDDAWDVDQVRDAYLRVCESEQAGEGLSLETWAKVVRAYLSRRGGGVQHGAGQSNLDALQLVAEFVLSMTLKDCSVLVTVAPWEPGLGRGDRKVADWVDAQNGCFPKELADQGSSLVTFGGRSWVYRATLLDLDPKQMSKVPDWLKLDQDIRDHFAASSAAFADSAVQPRPGNG